MKGSAAFMSSPADFTASVAASMSLAAPSAPPKPLKYMSSSLASFAATIHGDRRTARPDPEQREREPPGHAQDARVLLDRLIELGLDGGRRAVLDGLRVLRALRGLRR